MGVRHWRHWCSRENPRSLSSSRDEIPLSLLLSSTSLSSSSSLSSSWGWWPWRPWCPRKNPRSLSSSKAEKFEFDCFRHFGRREGRRDGRRDAQVTYTIRWSRIKTQKYCIIYFQKPQNTSFPMMYHSWFYDNFDFFKFPPRSLPPIRGDKK